MLLAHAMAAVLAGSAACTSDCTRVEYEQTSWGRQIKRFVLDPNGDFESWTFDFTSRRQVDHVKKRLGRSAHHEARLALRTLAKARDVNCQLAPTDMPYGKFRWSSGKRLHVYYGCYLRPESKRIARLRDAEDRFWRAVR